MKRKSRIFAFVMSLLMLCTFLPESLNAAQTVYFTSVNDMLLDLNDESMPFWQANTLYVSSNVFDSNQTDLGTTYSRSRDKMTAIIYRNRDVLMFDLAAGTIENNSTHELLSGSAIVRGGSVFFPINTVAKFFGFEYSCIKLDNGYLVRVKNEAAVLSDTAFIGAATFSMEQRLNQYANTHSSSSGSQGSGWGETDSGNRACLVIAVSDPEATEKLLTTLAANKVSATFLLSAQEIEKLPDLVRHIIISGNSVALKADAAQGSKATISLLEQANDALWTVSNTKTHLVFLQGASSTVTEEVRKKGYCPITPNIDYSERLLSASKMASNIAYSINQRGQCIAYLGTDSHIQSSFSSMLTTIQNGGNKAVRINEITAGS